MAEESWGPGSTEDAGTSETAGAGGADGAREVPEGGRADRTPEGGRALEGDSSGGGPVAPSPHLTEAELARSGELLNKIQALYGERVVGQADLRQSLLAALMARGHVLIESVPGLAKNHCGPNVGKCRIRFLPPHPMHP
jgi:hypothetical protein